MSSDVIFLHPETARGKTYCCSCNRPIRIEDSFIANGMTHGENCFCPHCLDYFLDFVFHVIAPLAIDWSRAKAQPIIAIVKETVSVKGELTVEEDLTIEGHVKGRIELKDHTLWISPNGKVFDAEIHAGNVIIAGNVMGNISAGEMVAIKSSGSVAGNIKCPRISIADGAKFKGSIDTEAKADTAARPDLSKAAVAHLGKLSCKF